MAPSNTDTPFTPFEAPDEDAEAKGATILQAVTAADNVSPVFGRKVRERFEENGVNDLTHDEWYPLQAYLDALREFSEDIGDNLMEEIGRTIPDNSEWPPHISTVEEGLASIQDAYEMNHRGADIGSYKFTELAEGRGEVVCRNPYPCTLDRGIVEGVARKFGGGAVTVTEESETCRMGGGDACRYVVEW